MIACKNSILEYSKDSPRRYSNISIGSGDCMIPWHSTETCLITITMVFLFVRIFIWIKLFYAIIVLVGYSYWVSIFDKEYYMESETFNHTMRPEIAHIMGVVFLTITLHLVDRQTDYMNRLAHLLNDKAKSEQEEAHELEYVNENLLLNILPKHVAKLYLDVNREMKELYFEKHNDVAIMFASLITDGDLQDDLGDYQFLLLMNKYITSFDTVSNRQEFRTIEKIKIAKWTYMVACGLFPGGKTNGIVRHNTSSNLETLLSFASELFKKNHQVNRNQQQQSKLRIGICHGPIVAGVVGSKKPLYDIWGDPVNMASRMDSTGKPNCIQVMETTADMIRKLGYVCESRGKVHVKGRDELVETYFVGLSSDFNIIKSSTTDDNASL
ncbi:hypothetical protein JTB14_004485 [Gonioctena quinquepunctata]|nr:hypothetical protein JTB14_004485 [Gonioctena quinquepunctata]